VIWVEREEGLFLRTRLDRPNHSESTAENPAIVTRLSNDCMKHSRSAAPSRLDGTAGRRRQPGVSSSRSATGERSRISQRSS
jgi:hypothetical protein